MNPDHYAKEAARLLQDDTLTHALDTVRQAALEDLARADADDKTMMIRLQQTVAVIDGIRDELNGAILRKSGATSSVGTVA